MLRPRAWKTELMLSLLCLLPYFHLVSTAEPSLLHPFRRSAGVASRKVEQKDRKFYKFITRPDIDAPTWNLQVYDREALAPGYWFIAPYQELDQGTPGDAWVGPHIYDERGELIWSGTGIFQHWNAFDFETTSVNGQQMMTILFPHGKVGMILDDSYRVWKQVPLDGIKADMHAFHVTQDGKRALVITHKHVKTTPEESQVVGFNGSCSAQYVGFAELNVNEPTPPVFVWSAYPQVGLNEGTYNRGQVEEECANNWDLLHANSIDKFPDGDYLVSSRHTDALYKVSHINGSIVWRLGGVKSDFELLGPGNPLFSRQHHAVVRSQVGNRTVISLFDNAVGSGEHEYQTNKEARGLLLSLDTVQMTAAMVAEYKHPKGHTVSSRGSFQILPNGNAFMCWTYSSYISEHAPNGTVIMEAILPVVAHSYRAFKYPWVGRPTQPPDVVSEAISTKRHETHTMVYVSWNGATEVANWAVYGKHPGRGTAETLLISAPRTGFETAITYEGVTEYVAVEALDANGESLGRSEIARTIPLEEQGLNQLPNLDPAQSALKGNAMAFATASIRDSAIPFALGFTSCTVIASVLVWSSRRSVISWRRSRGRGPKYELLTEEHLR